MSLLNVFAELQVPSGDDAQIFSAISLKKYPFAKLATNYLGHPVVLISSAASHNVVRRNIKLRYLEVSYNNECKVTEKETITFSNFIVIQFKNQDNILKTYFLNVVKTLMETLSQSPTVDEINSSIQNFIEIFRALSDQPTNTIQGLWSELFLIDNCKSPAALLYYWHNIPLEKFDFNAGDEKVEVKSSSLLNRIHSFSSDQLFAFEGAQILVASIFIKQQSDGVSISELIENIEKAVNNTLLKEKLLVVISKTLGSAIEHSLTVKYDYSLAQKSLRFYKHQDIAKIEQNNIPNRVSDVHYKSDLSLISAIDPSALKSNSTLFSSL